MDDPSPSRDPRLSSRANNRPFAVRTNSLDAQRGPSNPHYRPAPVDQQNNPLGEQFIQGISDLVQAAVVVATSRLEKEKLQKTRENTDQVLLKAKSHSSFPSTREYFQQVKNEEDANLARVEESLRQYEANYHRLENDLRSRWAASIYPQSSMSDEVLDKVDKLHRESEIFKEKLSSLEAVSRRLETQHNSLNEDMTQLHGLGRDFKDFRGTHDQEIKLLKDSLNAQQRGFANYTNTLSIQSMGIKENAKNTEEAVKRIEKLEDSPSTPLEVLGSLSSKYNGLVEDVQQKTVAWGEKIDSLWKAHKDMSTRQQKLEEQQRNFNQPAIPRDASPKLGSSIQALTNRLNDLESIQSAKDDLQLAEMEDLRKRFDEIKADQTGVLQEMNNLKATDSTAALETKVTGLAALVQQLQQLYETIRIGLHSLESRYNALSTEPIVQNMVVAMQEMYPSLDQVLAGLSAQKLFLDNEIPRLKDRLNKAEGQMKNTTLSQNELKQMRDSHMEVTQSLAKLWHSHQSQQQWLNEEDFGKMKSNYDTLATKFENMEGELRLEKNTYETLMQELQQARDNLTNRFENLDKTVLELNTQMAQVKSDNTIVLSLDQRVETLEWSTSQERQTIREQLDDFRAFMEGLRGSNPCSRSPPPRRSTVIAKCEPPGSDTHDTLDIDEALPRRKRRRHSSRPSSDEKSSFGSPASPAILSGNSTAVGGNSKRKKKKKRKVGEINPIIVED